MSETDGSEGVKVNDGSDGSGEGGCVHSPSMICLFIFVDSATQALLAPGQASVTPGPLQSKLPSSSPDDSASATGTASGAEGSSARNAMAA